VLSWFRRRNGATSLGVFTIHSILILLHSVLFSFIRSTGVLFGVESLFCLEESPLRLLEVDNVPDCVKVLQYDQQRVKRHTISGRTYIRLNVLVLEIEGLSGSQKLETQRDATS